MNLKFLKGTRFALAWGLLLFSSVSCWGSKEADNLDNAYDDHAKVQVVVESYSESKMSLSVAIDVESGWHIYAEDPGDVGMPTKFWFEDDGIKDLHVTWPEFSRTSVQLGEKVFRSNIYKGVTHFPITFTLLNDTEKQLQLHVSYAVCGEMCIPVSRAFTVEIPENSFNTNAR